MVITDPDQLTTTELTVTAATKLIKLNVAGNLSTDGVTLKCLYSKLKELWKTDATLIKYPFPMTPITDEQFEILNGWNFDNTHATPSNKTCNLIRTGGWRVYASDNTTPQEEWAGIITLGSLTGSDQVYYQTVDASGTATDVVLPGAVNQAVQVYGDASHGNIDTRSYFKLFVRTWQKSYASSTLSDIGVTAMTYQCYRFPLSNAGDLKVTHTEVEVAAYTGMSITWYATPQNKTIGGTPYPFHVIIEANGNPLQKVYEFVQWSLRQASDIDADAGNSKIGKVQNALLQYVGDTLYTLKQAAGGVFIDNFDAVDTNSVYFADDNWASSSDNRSYPYVASLTLQFGANLVAELGTDAIYRVFFTNDDAGANAGNDFGTSGAITVKDASDVDMAGNISQQASISKTFDYDGNVQRGGGSAGTPAPITVVAIGLNKAQYVMATGTIAKSKSNVVSLVAALERNYANA